MNRLRIGVIGLGHNGMAFCERYANHARCELAAVCDRDEARLKYAVDKFGVRGYNGYEILNEKGIDAISIHTPDCHHAEPFIKALETGHHVFVEKPMADNIEDCKLMVEAYRKHKGKTCMVGHVLRFDKYFSIVKKWIDLGILGDIFYVEADYIHDLRCQYHMEEWKIVKEIPMLGGGCHPLDILRWYVGDAIEVSAMSNHIAYPEMKEDASIIATYRFANGAVGKVTTLYGNVSPRPYVFNLSIYGTKGSIVRGKLSLEGMGEKWMNMPESFDSDHDYSPEIEHFLTCIEKNQKPLITPQDASNTVIAALYAVKACKEKSILQIPGI
ncbi:MAG: Gfo/Idh/MocA family oxidoreductase [Clostridiaceae bacterium]|nr:Gfo/Idh/MocA family oxidoreductase [Clostridiaceae bacterium]